MKGFVRKGSLPSVENPSETGVPTRSVAAGIETTVGGKLPVGWFRRLRKPGPAKPSGKHRQAPAREKMLRARVRVTGRVQGVYYRAHARNKAARLGVVGWVRNLADGSVEGVVEGNEPSVRAMLDWCRIGSPRAVVDKVDVIWEPYTGEFDRFSVRDTRGQE